MKYFDKIKRLIEGKDITPGSLPISRIGISDRDDELAAKTAAQMQRDKDNERLERQTRPSGEMSDRQDAPYSDLSGDTITTDTDAVKNRQSWKSMDPEQLKKDAQSTGTGVHGSTKKFGVGTLSRAAGTIQGLADAMDNGVPIIPAKDRPYEDETGQLLRFGQINTGLSNGDPYYFEFDHIDRSTGQHLVLYGRGAGASEPAGYGRSIPLRVKAIVPPGGKKPEQLALPAPSQPALPAPKVNQPTVNESSIYKIKNLVEGTFATIAKPGATAIPERILKHPQIVSLLNRFKLLDEIETRVKVGGTYGILVRKDPGDKNSIWKLTKKIHDDYIPEIQITPEWEDEFDDHFGGPGTAAAIGAGAISLAAAEAGMEDGASGEQVAKAMGKYTQGEGVIELPASDVTELPDDNSVEVPDRTEQPDEYEDEDQKTTKRPVPRGSSKKFKPGPIPGTAEHSKQKKEQELKKDKIRAQNREAKRRQRRRDKAKKDGVELFPNHPDAKRKPGRKPKKPVANTKSSKGNEGGGSITKFKPPPTRSKRKVAESLLKIKQLTTGKNT